MENVTAKDAPAEPGAVERVVERINKTMDRIDRRLPPAASNDGGNQGVAQVTIAAGSVGVWLATTACLMMLVMNVILGFLYLDLRRESARVADYQQTEYMLIPEIKKIVDSEMAKRKEK